MWSHIRHLITEINSTGLYGDKETLPNMLIGIAAIWKTVDEEEETVVDPAESAGSSTAPISTNTTAVAASVSPGNSFV